MKLLNESLNQIFHSLMLSQGKGLMETYIYQPSEEELQLRPEDLPEELEEAADDDDNEALGAVAADNGCLGLEGGTVLEGFLLHSSSGLSHRPSSLMRTMTGGGNSRMSSSSRSMNRCVFIRMAVEC